MESRTRLGLGILGAALILGGLGDTLLRATPWGINFLLWVSALAVAGIALTRLGVPLRGDGRWFAVVAVLFAGGVLWRDSPVLVALDVGVVLLAISLAIWRSHEGSLRRAGISEYVIGATVSGALSSAGPLPVAVRDIQWREVAPGRWQGPALAVTRGLLISAPVLLVFGGLFVAADAVFERLVFDFFGFDLAEALGHLALICALAWISCGALWTALLANSPAGLTIHRPPALSLGILEVGIVVGLLDLLFAAFVAIQVRYLFGGAGRVLAADGLTYAEYARRGFFELVTVTALALPLLLLAHWLLRADNRIAERAFRWFAVVLVALQFVVVASALQRMYLYTQQFGLTELRLYTTAFMLWLSIVLLWLLATVVRGRRDRFAFGALVSGLAAVLLINIINPDALIARTNIARAQDDKELDVPYLASLSADAVPVLVESYPEVGDERIYEDTVILPSGKEKSLKGPMLEEEVTKRWSKQNTDWRSWNLSRYRARAIVEKSVRDATVSPSQGHAN